MKLIIDIPKSDYVNIKRYCDGLPDFVPCDLERTCIAKGVPLEDIKTAADETVLYKTVKELLDDIVESDREYGYLHFCYVAEKAEDILKLIEMEEEKNDKTK